MKKIYFLVVALCLFTSVNAQIINFPNANFKAKLLSANTTNTIAKDINGNNIKIDANNDSEIQISEALNISELNIRYANLTNLGGIEFFFKFKSFKL